METFTNNPLEESGTSQKVQKFLSLLFLLLALLGYLFYIKPAGVALAEKDLKYNELTAQEATLSAHLAELDEASKKLELDSEVKAQKVANAIPQKLEQDNLLLNMVEIAKKNDIQFQSISFSVSDAGEDVDVKKVGISASFEGNYGDLVNFLKSIEANGRKIVVENISVQLAGEPIQGVERVNFALSMAAFFRNGI